MITIQTYQEQYKEQIIRLILSIQNDEAKIHLSLAEQPDLKDIPACYEKDGGEFWIATENDKLIGTIALMNFGSGNAVLKKFFVKKEYRNKGLGQQLYRTLLRYAEEHQFHTLLLDTPSVAKASHKFYEKAGFIKINREQLPFPYEYPDRDSVVYLLRL